MTEPAQCPNCNRWSDRNEHIKELRGVETLSADRYFACLHPQCQVYMFPGDGSPGMKLNLKGIRDSNRTVSDVIHEKLSTYEFKD